MYGVYIKTDDNGNVVDINSDAFIVDTTGWTEIDSGDGDRYHHAQGNYFPKPLTDDNGVYRYKYSNGVVVERSAEEMAEDMPAPAITQEQRMDAMENALEEIINIIMEG